ncbi:MAG: hypothetical protein GX750_10465 [Clostridia bacterium]|nr:hypothetical protein [Clostridia bacterium]
MRWLPYRRAFILLLLILGILTGGCKTRSEPAKPADYFPMTKGSYWEYEGEGNEFASFTREVLFTGQNRAQLREDNGGTVMASVIETTDTAVIRVFSRGEAYGEENYLEKQSNENTVLLQSPIEVGTRWEFQEGTKEITDTQAVVKTPAGEFNDCIAVTAKIGESTVVEYYKAGIGMVKREFNSEGFTVTSSLKKYEIK